MTEYHQFCALARAAEILGERWTLLIVRELYLGPKRFSDLMARLQPIAPGVLNGRLRALEHRGLVRRVDVGPPTPARLYELSEAGRALEPALFELLRWGARYLFPARPGERFEVDWLAMVLRAYARPAAAFQGTLALRIEGHAEGIVYLTGGEDGLAVGLAGPDPGAVIETSAVGLLGLMSSGIDFEAAVAQGLARVEGDLAIARQFQACFTTGRER